MTEYVAYFRMPATGDARQRSVLARQKAAIAAFLGSGERTLVGEFTEVVRPSHPDEPLPALDQAIDCGRRFDAILLAALSEAELGVAARDMARDAGVEIMLIEPAESAPEAGRAPPAPAPPVAPYLPLGARARRSPPPHPAPLGNRQKADAFARAILPVIEQIRAGGATSLTEIANELNARHIRTARGRRWHPTTVRNILNRTCPRSDDA